MIDNEIFGPVTIGILGDIFFSIFCYFIINAYFFWYFAPICYLEPIFSRRLKFIRLVLAIFIPAGCIYGYFDADIDRQKEEYSPAFIASLVAICIYVLVATFAPNSFLMILYAIIYTLSFCASAWPVFHW
ncbi:hypothetical protein CAMRE0001_1835 [Campylobacter rectus RM3267]|uniref:Uncharacterized protein n=2 Tax=Campylobacter rectus TaxID=203 RepID=B9CYK9_CAMRE|nr:hypothetical protein [Campylobacter rectus]EEF15154.1 hypothetical protein CAMRE0001_1835 [Campylobacter rectus RM3267]QCD47643.1 putative membrane protein [Campylobacter rectus]UEB48341.1 hypothetical protein LK437_03215 [Campylobacter rectus]